MDRSQFVILWLVGSLVILGLIGAATSLLRKNSPHNAIVGRIGSIASFGWIIAIIGLPIIDLSGGNRSKSEIAADLFALPDDLDFTSRQSRPKTPLCWQNEFALSGEATLDQATRESLYGDAMGNNIRNYVAAHYGLAPNAILFDDDALDWQTASAVYDLRDGKYWSPTRLKMMLNPFVCAAIERNGKTVRLRRCDPLAEPKDSGNAGRIRATLDRHNGDLDYQILHEDQATSCRNPVRRAINRTLGLEHR